MALAEIGDLNLATHFTWVQRRTRGMRVRDDPGFVLTDSGLPCDTFNAVCRARLTPPGAEAAISEAVGWFTRAGRPFSWWVGPADTPSNLGALLESGGRLEPSETELAMALDLTGLETGNSTPRGLDIQPVTTAAQVRAFAEINAANWSPPDPWVLHFYEVATPVLLARDSPIRLYLGYLDGAPVATAELTTSAGVVGLYNVATLEAYRRRGIGSAMTLRPLLDAARDGRRTAVLQAAPDGVGVYRRIGFVPYGEITEYKPAP